MQIRIIPHFLLPYPFHHLALASKPALGNHEELFCGYPLLSPNKSPTNENINISITNTANQNYTQNMLNVENTKKATINNFIRSPYIWGKTNTSRKIRERNSKKQSPSKAKQTPGRTAQAQRQ